jgi:Bacterial extracellular solute-binding protein
LTPKAGKKAVAPAAGGTLGIPSRAPHPNAAKVFVNWFLSREGQIVLQKFGRPDAHNSRRIDIPKDDVDLYNRLESGKKYFLAKPEYQDLTPIFKLVKTCCRRNEPEGQCCSAVSVDHVPRQKQCSKKCQAGWNPWFRHREEWTSKPRDRKVPYSDYFLCSNHLDLGRRVRRSVVSLISEICGHGKASELNSEYFLQVKPCSST